MGEPSPEGGRRIPAPNSPAAPIETDRGTLRVCCGQLIEPRLAEVEDRYGQTLFAAVWRCPRCGRVTF